ncbi:MAG: GIY-YIG nuclease family protein [Betaproteobacteria bacterium]|nr:GIY-YIG nuclease family protein [Betaproteobacteria bacterium]
MTNSRRTALYTGVTGDLAKRAWEHKEKFVDGFTTRYNASKLVYCEVCSDALAAITREKQIKSGSRRKKLDLIYNFNPEWRDLAGEL